MTSLRTSGDEHSEYRRRCIPVSLCGEEPAANAKGAPFVTAEKLLVPLIILQGEPGADKLCYSVGADDLEGLSTRGIRPPVTDRLW